LSTGCTVFGGYIGSITKTNHIFYNESELLQSDFAHTGYSNIKAGDKLKIILINGDSLMTEFMEFQKLSMNEYSRKYLKMREIYGSNVFFPEFHDTLTIIYRNKTIEHYEFLGFDYACIQVGDFNEKIYKIPLNTTYRLTLSGNDYASLFTSYNEMMTKGQIPTLSTVEIINNGIFSIIPLNEISQIITMNPYRKNYAIEGTAIGLGIDILILALLYDYAQNMPISIDLN